MGGYTPFRLGLAEVEVLWEHSCSHTTTGEGTPRGGQQPVYSSPCHEKDANDQNRVVEGEETRFKGSPLGGEV